MKRSALLILSVALFLASIALARPSRPPTLDARVHQLAVKVIGAPR